jgi:hypothetical protein
MTPESVRVSAVHSLARQHSAHEGVCTHIKRESELAIEKKRQRKDGYYVYCIHVA